MTHYNITACAVCNYPLGNDWKAEKVCPYCDTRYDLIHRKVDKSKTMIMPSDCRHNNQLFISGGEDLGAGGSGRHSVYVCPDCGQFRVFGTRDGVTFEVTFDLPTKDTVTASGKWLQLLESEKFRLADKSRLFGPWMRRDEDNTNNAR